MSTPVFPERTAQTTTSTGTGTLTLAGAIAGHQSLGASQNTRLLDYVIEASDGAWEIVRNGVYTHTGTLLTRGTFVASSTGTALALPAGTHTVRIGPIGSRASKWDTGTVDASPLSITITGAFLYPIPILLIAPPLLQVDNTISGLGKWANNITYSEQNSALPVVSLTSATFNDLVGAVDLSITNSIALTTLSLPVLTTVGNTITLTGLAALTTLSLPALTTVVNTTTITSGSLTTLSLPALTTTGCFFNPNNLPLLTTLSLPVLSSVGSTLGIQTLAALTTLSLPALTTTGFSFFCHTMAALTTLSIPVLSKVGGNFQPHTMGSLTSISVPALTRVGVSITISTGMVITSWSSPALISVGQNITITPSLSALTTVTLGTIGTLKSVGGNISFFGEALTEVAVDHVLALVASLDGTNGTTSWGTGKQLILDLGTNAPPSAAGLVNKDIIVARGGTVFNNI